MLMVSLLARSWFTAAVTRVLGRRRVVVAVEPRLLADALARALERTDVDVVIHLDSRDVHVGTAEFDLALVSGDTLPDGVGADVVVYLPDGVTGDAVVQRQGDRRTARVGGLAALDRLIDDLLAGQRQDEGSPSA